MKSVTVDWKAVLAILLPPLLLASACVTGQDAESTRGSVPMQATQRVAGSASLAPSPVPSGTPRPGGSAVATQLLGRLPDTGQRKAYTATFGEDSDYTVNPPVYSDNGDSTVTDRVTGLV